jgi:hypothetical protein
MGLKRAITFLIFFLVIKNLTAQRLDVHLAVGALASNLLHDLKSQSNMISHESKIGYRINVVGQIDINKKFKAGASIGYIRLGDSRLANAGYSQNNTEIFGNYQPWSTVKYDDIVKLNYYTISIIASHQLNNKFDVGINLNGLLLASNSIKRKIYVSNFEANYAEIIWYNNEIADVKKINLSPEFFLNMNTGKKTNICLSFLHSITSVFKNSNVYHQSLILTFGYKLK